MPARVPTAVPTTVSAAVLIVLLEAVAVAVFALVELINLDPERPSVAVTSGVFFLLYAALLATAARGLCRLQAWSRSVIVMAQALQLALAWSFYGGDTQAVGIALAVPALVVLALALAPPTTQALFERPDQDDDSASSQRP